MKQISLRSNNPEEYKHLESQNESLLKLPFELDVDKDEDLQDVLSNTFWDDLDMGNTSKVK